MECQQRFVVQKSFRTGQLLSPEEYDDHLKMGATLPEIGHLNGKVRFLPTTSLRIPYAGVLNRHK